MAEDEIENIDEGSAEDYSLMLVLERLETLREELDEVGFSTLQEIEATLSITNPGSSNGTSNSTDLTEKRAQLEEIRDEMLDLDVDTYQEINDQIRAIHTQLDEKEDV